MSDRAFLIALDGLTRDDMEETLAPKEKKVGNPRVTYMPGILRNLCAGKVS